MYAPVTGRLGEGHHAQLFEQVVHLLGGLLDHGKADPGGRVEVDAQLVGVAGVGGPGRPDVKAQAGQVDRPQHMGQVTGHQGLGRSAVGGGHDRGLEPFRMVLRHALLEERRAGGAVGEPLEQDRAAAHGPHQRLLDGLVVVDQVQLRLSPLGEEDLTGAGDAHLAPGGLDDSTFVVGRADHGATVRRWRPSQDFYDL